MWGLLKELGFNYKKRDRRQYVIEQPQVIAKRHDYLQRIRTLEHENNYDIIYTNGLTLTIRMILSGLT